MFNTRVSRISLVLVLALLGATVATAVDTYTPENKSILCQCRTITVYRLTSADFDQSAAAQDAAWTGFKASYPGIVDSDRLGNRTKTYNCHSYAFNGSDRWLDSPDGYFGTTSGCWTVDASGSVKSSSAHSCMVSENTGKCGQLFLCKNNQYVYSPMPSTIYKYVP